ncbi:Golgi transport complex subunit 3 [Recurvomyces mirabilis]|nr:Golgi transport complex subunit 3 [Recurvomyces mirabilis]
MAVVRADAAIEAIPETSEVYDAWSGPPVATLSKRAQSYHDFYEVVTSQARKEDTRRRRRSLVLQERTNARKTTEASFHDDFLEVQDVLLGEGQAGHAMLHEQLELSSSHLHGILMSAVATLDVLSRLSTSFRNVEAQTDAFRQQCEGLVAEQQRMTALADAIEENARYYSYLEPITRRLNSPGAANLVKGHEFPEMLSNLDNCLVYMETHPKHKESATYRSRYRLLLTRGLTLIRHHFMKSLGDIAADISKRLQSGQLKATTHSALLYAKFRVPAPELKALGLEIQKRAAPTPDDVDADREPEYASLLRELYQSYSATRGRLVLPIVSKKMAELGAMPQHADVLVFAKASFGFMRGICLDEYELWYAWFETDGALYDFLESLMEPLYDYLRPKIIHETKLETLCELCSAIQGQYMGIESDEEDEESFVASPIANGKPLGRTLNFASLVHAGLEDAQTRLVFLALTVLRDGIENYKPKPQDLDWPKPDSATDGAKGPALSGTRSSVSQTPTSPAAGEEIDDATSMFSKHVIPNGATIAAKHEWYPTLRKAIWLLRRIYRLLNSTVFDDLAHRIVHSTIYSLVTASQQIKRQKTPQDGQLFLITHLLNLKQQIVAFDIEFSPPEVDFDFSAVTNTFYELRDRGSLWNPASWVTLVSGAVGGGLLPKVVENMLDAKAELDGRLRTVINEFVNSYANHITAPVDPVTIAQAKATSKDKDAEFDGLKAVRTVRGLAEKDVPSLRTKLEEFVDDARTRETLVAAVRDQVVLSYEEFVDSWSEGKSKKLSRKGKGREDEIWGVDLFAEVMEKVFLVGEMVGQGDDGDADSMGGGYSDRDET